MARLRTAWQPGSQGVPSGRSTGRRGGARRCPHQQSGMECVTRMGVTSKGPICTGDFMSRTWNLQAAGAARAGGARASQRGGRGRRARWPRCGVSGAARAEAEAPARLGPLPAAGEKPTGPSAPLAPVGVVEVELLEAPRHQLQHKAAAVHGHVGVECWDDPWQRADVVLVACGRGGGGEVGRRWGGGRRAEGGCAVGRASLGALSGPQLAAMDGAGLGGRRALRFLLRRFTAERSQQPR
jgi:hypothetical protein